MKTEIPASVIQQAKAQGVHGLRVTTFDGTDVYLGRSDSGYYYRQPVTVDPCGSWYIIDPDRENYIGR